MFAKWGNGLLNLSYALFLILYVFAAAAYGLTREAPLAIFLWGMGGTFLLWITAHALLCQFPSTGVWPWVTSGLILLFGWFVTIIGAINDAVIDGRLSGWDDDFSLALLNSCAAYDWRLSVAAMLRTTALLGAMLIAIEMWRRPRWSQALVFTMIFSSLGMVIFFFLQRIGGGVFLLESQDEKTTLSFATYRYWGNAAAYLNLFWPILAGVALLAAIRQTFGWPLWFIPFGMVFVANFLNVSKAGNFLAGLGTVLFAAFAFPIFRNELRRNGHRIRLSHLLVALIPILVIAASLPFALPWKRWDYLAQTANQETTGGRLHAYESFLKILPESSWCGFGPGSFKKYYFRYVEDDPKLRSQSYWVAHQDYIQTAIEWGYIGSLLWAFGLIPPIFLLARATRGKPERPSNRFPGYRIGIMDNVKAFFATLPTGQDPGVIIGAFVAVSLTALHSLVDFPMQIASLQLYFLTLLALGWSFLGSKSTPIG